MSLTCFKKFVAPHPREFRFFGGAKLHKTYALVATIGLVVACWLTSFGFPEPRVDDAFYKSPGAELAGNGRLAIPCAKGFLPRAELIFSTSPPVYQLLLAGWYKIFGFSLRTTLAFSYTVHILSAIAVMVTATVLVRKTGGLPVRFFHFVVGAVGVIHLGNLAYFDRQEETALLFIWPLVALPREPRASPLVAGLLVGAAGLTSLWVGMLGGLFVTVREVLLAAGDTSRPRAARFHSAARYVLVCGAVGAAMGAAWLGCMESLYPGIIREQFLLAAEFLRRTQMTGSITEKLALFAQVFVLYNPPHLLPTLVVLAFFPLAIRRCPLVQSADPWALYLTSLAGFAAVALKRPIAYTYLGAAQMLLLPCLAVAVKRFCDAHVGASRFRVNVGVLVVGACVLTSLRDTAVWSYCGLTTPPSEQVDAVYDRLRDKVPPSARVAVLAPHWYAFQFRNPWREAYFSSLTDPSEVLSCGWLVLHPDYATPEFIDGFELVEKLTVNTRIWQPFSFELWRQKRISESGP